MSNNNEKLVKDIRRRTRKKYSSEEKIRIVLEGMRGEESIAELCRREGLNQNVYYRWSKEFLEAGKQRLAGDIKREASSSEVTGLKKENDQLKRLVADIMLKNDVLKKSVLGLETTYNQLLLKRHQPGRQANALPAPLLIKPQKHLSIYTILRPSWVHNGAAKMYY